MKKTYKYRADKENGFATFQTKPASSIKTLDLNRQIPPFYGVQCKLGMS